MRQIFARRRLLPDESGVPVAVTKMHPFGTLGGVKWKGISPGLAADRIGSFANNHSFHGVGNQTLLRELGGPPSFTGFQTSKMRALANRLSFS